MRLKAQVFSSLSGEVFVRGRFELTILRGPRMIRLGDVYAIRLLVSVKRDDIPLPIDGDLIFVNPPIKVPDGSGGFVVNLRQALRDMVIEAIQAQAP